MNWQDLLTDGYERVLTYLESVLDGLSYDDLTWQPRYDCNSIGWTAWHLTRQQDAQVASLAGEEQLWIKEQWYLKFNRNKNPQDIGFGHTPQQVAAFKPPEVQLLLDYQRAVLERSKRYFQRLSEEELDRKLDEPQYQPLPTVGIRLVSILEDSLIHIGQAAYLRGLLQGKGWQSY